ncbi:MAG: hypothetical protein DRP74_01885 [Candidatus Omnitrophota bacterium]|nr:MAG: hypothetical protein DRP74_01885 [Candidatus Omnitrophota bacterium]
MQFFLLISSSVLLVIFSIFSVQGKLAHFFSIPLPIAIHGNFPIPIIFWAGMFIYSLVASSITKCSQRTGIRKILATGFFMHMLLLLLRLKIQAGMNPEIFSSFIYKWYFELFFLSAFTVLVLYSAKLVYSIVQGCKKEFISLEEESFSLPFLPFLVYIITFLFLKKERLYGSIFILEFLVGLTMFLFFGSFLKNTCLVYLKKIRDFILQEKIFIILIFCVSVLIRLFYLYRIMQDPDYILTGSDGTLYDSLAHSFIMGEKVTEPLVAGYWMFVALIYRVFSRSYLAVGIIQAILTSFGCVFVYFAAKYIFNIRVARIIAIISAVNFASIFSSAAIGHQALDIFYSTLILLLISQFITLENKSPGSNILILVFLGVTFGLSIATREINLFFPFIFAAWLIFYPQRKTGLKKVSLYCLAMFVFTALTLAPFAVRNLKNTGALYPVSATENAAYPLIDHYLKGENPDLIKAGIDLSQPKDLVRVFYEKPFFVSGVLANNFWHKFKALYFNQGYGGFDMLFLYRLSGYYYAMWFYAYLFTIIGIFLAFRRYGFRLHSIAFFFIVYRTLVHFLTEGSYRHRAAIEPFLLLYLSFGLYAIIKFIRSSQDEAA